MRTVRSRTAAKLRELLIAARKEAAVSQVELAKKLKRTQSAVSEVERGQRRLDVIEFLIWCETIRIDPSKLLRRLRSSRR